MTRTEIFMIIDHIARDMPSSQLTKHSISFQGQHNDSRMNLAIALTAIRRGATCVNHVEVEELLKKKIRDGK